VSADSRSELAASLDANRGMPPNIPADTRVFRFEESFFFPNTQRVKRSVLDTIQTFHSPEYNSRNGEEADRLWSVEGERRIARLRKKAQIEPGAILPVIAVVILDFARVNFFDTSAVIGLKNFLAELKQYAGNGVEVRLVGLNEMVRDRFERAGWTLLDGDASMDSSKPTNVRVFRSVADAVRASRAADEIVEVIVKNDDMSTSEDNNVVSHREKV
jgi:solute carrier family 26 (sodium-independent sulfate anion transporter), member 11